MIPLLLGLLVHPAHGDCPSTSAEVAGRASAALEAYTALDIPAFREHHQAFSTALDCLSEPLAPEHAARVHLAWALASWVDRDRDRLAAAFRGVLAADPEYEPGPEIAPDGSAVLDVFQQAWESGPGPEVPLAADDLWVDGEQRTAVPTERAAVVQLRPPGDALHTWYTWGEGLPPALAALEGDPESPVAVDAGSTPGTGTPGTASESPSSGRGQGLLWGAGALSAAGAVVAFVVADAAYDAFWQTDVPADARDLYRRNRTANATGAGLSVVATGCVVGAVVSGRW